MDCYGWGSVKIDFNNDFLQHEKVVFVRLGEIFAMSK